MTEKEIRTLLNKILKELFFKILRIQEKVVSKSSNERISRTEMHMLETIEESQKATLTCIADELGITKATASVSVARLATKGFIEKIKSDRDKRTTILKLTEKGEMCCNNHRQFHEMMVQSILKDFRIKQYPDVLKSLRGLSDFFSSFEE